MEYFIEKFLKDYCYNDVNHYYPTNNEILIVNNCCSKKNTSCELLAAKNRYEGREIKIINSLKPNFNFDHYIISAKYGLIKDSEPIKYYNKTFCDCKKTELYSISPYLHIREDLETLIKKNNYKLCFILLGDNYLTVLNTYKPFNVDSTLFSFTLDKQVPIQSNYTINVPLKTQDYIKKFKKYNSICLKSGIIKELFLCYPNYEFLTDNSLIKDFITN